MKSPNKKAYVAGTTAAGTAGLVPLFLWIYTDLAKMPAEAAWSAAAASAAAVGAVAGGIWTWLTKND